MKWFTRDWIRGDPSAGVDTDVIAAYQAHLLSIWPQLPPGIRAFAKPSDGRMSVHDACVEYFTLDPHARSLSMTLVSGNNADGYANLKLELVGVELISPSVAELNVLLSDPTTQFGYEEIDLRSAESPFELRFILFPRGEIALGCDSLAARFEPLPNSSDRVCRHLVDIRD